MGVIESLGSQRREKKKGAMTIFLKRNRFDEWDEYLETCWQEGPNEDSQGKEQRYHVNCFRDKNRHLSGKQQQKIKTHWSFISFLRFTKANKVKSVDDIPFSCLTGATWQMRKRRGLQTQTWSTNEAVSNVYFPNQQSVHLHSHWNSSPHLVLISWHKSLKRVSDLKKST